MKETGKRAQKPRQGSPDDIAVVGMAVDLPGAPSVGAYWELLRDGVEAIEELSPETLSEGGEKPELLTDPNYVPSAALLRDFDHFDAEFFGFSPKEAAILDPQHRKFLEVAWSAIEDSGHTPEALQGKVGVYAGCGMGSYFYFNICSNPELVDDVGMFLLRHTGNDKDFLSTRVSHVFDLKGPSVNVQTACSTSLVAIHYASEALRQGDCDMAIAGGVTIELPQGRGYLYRENEILSPDGHCHAFDHRAQGTVFGSGAGAVALRRLEDAVADGDHIWAVIKGSAINNDGAAKAGYLAPSVDGQSAAIRKALTAARVNPDSIGYVECHGTGTYIGDPIEVAALTNAFQSGNSAVGTTRIGSVKTNIGHLDTAAGVAGFVKTVLALKHKSIPPSLGYEKPNPTIAFEQTPFIVNDRLTSWQPDKAPLRAGVNALGVGGTNAHTVLEEAPERTDSAESLFSHHVLCVSGQTKAALDANTANLAQWLRANPNAPLADVAFTLKDGRRGFEKRRAIVAANATEAAQKLETGNPRDVFDHDLLGANPEVVFMFPGGGAQYAGMARDLYDTEPVFAEWMDRGLDHLLANHDVDLRTLWLPEDDMATANEALLRPSAQLPLIMLVEYALAKLWISWGVSPTALVGHSMGENTAACLAGVLSFEDCIDLVYLRGRLFDTVAPGGMLSISLPLADVEALVGDELDIASVNGPALTAVSGPNSQLDALAKRLTAKEIDFQRIPIDIAAHSRMLEPILNEYRNFLEGLSLSAPKLPIISNRTAVELTAKQATSPEYWVEQLRSTVRFADCINALAEGASARVYLEVGPGKALSSLAQMSPSVTNTQVLSSLRHPDQEVEDDVYFLSVIGRLWACGVEADWGQIWDGAARQRLSLPTYAFQRNRYFIEPGQARTSPEAQLPARHIDMTDWGYRGVWRPRYAECPVDVEHELERAACNWVLFEDDLGYAKACGEQLRAAGHSVVSVRAGDTFGQVSDDLFLLAPEEGRFGYAALFEELRESGRAPDRIGHFWCVTQGESYRPGSSFFDRNRDMGFGSLTALGQALAEVDLDTQPHVCVVTTGAVRIGDEPFPTPEKALIAGPVGVIPREVPGTTVATVDIELAPPSRGLFMVTPTEDPLKNLTSRLLEELMAEAGNSKAAWRGTTRYTRTLRPITLSETGTSSLKQGGHYLITGGFGGIGLTIARHLMERYDAKISLLSRGELPPEENWDVYLRQNSRMDKLSQRIYALRELSAIGSGKVDYLAADVCDPIEMKSATACARERFGAINGVIHAAGQIDDAPMLAKNETDMARVLAPKVDGLRVIDSLFEDGDLDLLVLFSSSSTITKPIGQVDYVAANEFLNAYAQARAEDRTKVIAINWGIWADTGMAAEAMAEREAQRPDKEVTASDAALWDQRGFDAQGNPEFSTTLTPQNSWLLDEHRTTDGTAILPGTGGIELMVEAVEDLHHELPLEIRDLYFLQGFVVPENTASDAVLTLLPHEQGYRATLQNVGQGSSAMTHEADIHTAAGPRPQLLDLDKIRARCPAIEQSNPDGCLHSPQEEHLRFGPRWHVLKETALGNSEGLARLALPDCARQDGARLHPGLLDLATGWAIALAPGYDGSELWVPLSYERITIYEALGPDIYSYMRCTEGTSADKTARFDITLTDPDGKVLVDISGFVMQQLSGGFQLASQASTAAVNRTDEGSTQPQLSSEERRLRANLKNGILAAEGAEAFERALALDIPSIVVSSIDLKALVEQADSAAAGSTGGFEQSFERPELDSDYIAPSTAIEEAIAKHFETLLGVSKVGVNDSFFDLGGHSLIAVRLFAQIKRSFGVELPLATLFDAPTVAQLAALLEQATGLSGAAHSDETKSVQKADPERTFTHLVKLSPGSDPKGIPFFIVAGMFGNVLNLRHLAQLVGTERPVYGLQARGLIGEDAPHETMEEAARDCIAEMQQIQSEGPYLIGGFSGGGITAYEIAQQLRLAEQEVGALVLLDTPLPRRPELSAQDKTLIKLAEFRSKGLSYVQEWVQNRVEWEIRKRRATPVEGVDNTGFNNRKIELAFRRAIEQYNPAQWTGDATLYRPVLDKHWKVSGGNWVSREREYVFEDNDWTKFVPKLEIVEVPGDHDGMVLQPNVNTLGHHIKLLLSEAVLASNPRLEAAE